MTTSRQATVKLATILLVVAASVTGSVAEDAVPRDTYAYKQVGDLKIQADVYRLAGNEVRPAIIWIHGGALIMGNRDMLGWGPLKRQLQRYLEAGYVVVSIDYRLAPETKLPAIVDDLRDAYAWIRETGPAEFQIDRDRIAVIGMSAGGYLTLMSGFCVEPRPQALVSFYGYGDIVGDWYAKPDPYYNRRPRVTEAEARRGVGNSPIAQSDFEDGRERFYLFCRQRGLWPYEVMGRDPVTEKDAFEHYCPLRNVTVEYPPTLLLHGDQDTDVPYQRSVVMAEELKRHGVSHTLITLHGHDHAFDLGDEQAIEVKSALEQVIVFLDKHLDE